MLVRRYEGNPILKPSNEHSWEASAVFNGCPVKKGKKVFLLYRALSLPQYNYLAKADIMLSTIGIAESDDGINFGNRRCFIRPEYDWELFGCEDPRVMKFEGEYYIFYTALGSWPPQADKIRVGLAISKDLKTVEEKHLVTPFNAKAMALFPERINNKIWAVLTVHTDKPPARICLVQFQKKEDIWSEKFWNMWYANFQEFALTLQRRPQDHVEVGAPPLKTKYGWLLLYSYIRDYFGPGKRLFGVEAVLLDLKNPFKIVGKTDFPILYPSEYYEKYGLVEDVVFPSGAMLEKDTIYLYYGSADTTCSLAFINLPSLLHRMIEKEKERKKVAIVRRSDKNPIITPIREHPWESKATFNPAAIYLDGKVHILYRAMSDDNTSSIGYATSSDGETIDYRSPEPIYVPSEQFEMKLEPGANSGCEDPRVTLIGDRIYMTYTAFDGRNPPKVALTWIKVEDFLKRRWNWAKPVIISPPGIHDKNAFIFPEKVHGKYLIIHRIDGDIDYAFSDTLEFHGERYLEENRWILPRKGWWDSVRVGACAPPIKTDDGWIMFYHGVSDEGVYRVGAVLLDLNDPLKVLARTDYPILEPEKDYEKFGQVPNVVFPCGNVAIGGKIFIYYGGGDTVVGVAVVEIKKLLEILKRSKLR